MVKKEEGSEKAAKPPGEGEPPRKEKENEKGTFVKGVIEDIQESPNTKKGERKPQVARLSIEGGPVQKCA